MTDFERLLDGLHQRGIKLIVDLVINHTSDEHEWFLESQRSEDSEYREYYFWRSGDDSEPPNNWRALWGGPAWTRDDATDEYYLHLFHEKQAELNWNNSVVREELFDIAQWWLDAGVDGFRLDSINLISKPDGLPDADPEGGLIGLNVVVNGPRVQEYLREFCRRMIQGWDRDRDIATIRSVEHAVDRGDLSGFTEVKDLINDRTRDNARTPMQWSEESNAGFTTSEPWIKVNDEYDAVNVETERDHPDSIWRQYQRLIEIRDEYPVLVHGDFRLLLADHPEIFSYLRTLENERMLVILNVSRKTPTFCLPETVEYDDVELLIHNDVQANPNSVTDVDLQPYEARMYRLL